MRNKMGSEPYFRSSRITSGWQSTPYCGQVRHSKKFGASSRGTVTNPDFLKNPGARATRKILLPPRFLVSAIPRSSRAFPSFSFRYSGSTAMPSTINSPCLSARTKPPIRLVFRRILIRLRLCTFGHLPALNEIRRHLVVFFIREFQVVGYEKRYQPFVVVCRCDHIVQFFIRIYHNELRPETQTPPICCAAH